MSRHADKALVLDVLLETGRRAAMDSTAEHPEDIATMVTLAIESAAVALHLAHVRGLA